MTERLLPFLTAAGLKADRETILKITPLIHERLTVLSDAPEWVDFFFVDQLPDYDLNLLVPQKMSLAEALPILQHARAVLAETAFTHEALDTALRAEAQRLGVKPGQMFQPIRVAVCGKMVAPPLFETLAISGRETVLKRLNQALERLQAAF